MKEKKYLKILYLFLILIILLKDASALNDSERTDLKNKIEELKYDKENFENLLTFLNKEFNLDNEPEIRNALKTYSEDLNININKYSNIFREEISQQNKEKTSTTLRLVFILLILLVLIYLIKRFIKNKNEVISKKR